MRNPRQSTPNRRAAPMHDRPLTHVDAILESIAEKSAKRDRTLQRLQKSLAIRAIWKGAFDGGSNATIRCGTMTVFNWERFERGMIDITDGYIVRLNDGETFPLSAHQFRTLHNMPNGK